MDARALALQRRTRAFAAAVIQACDGFPRDIPTQRIVMQLVDASGATDSNYRAACRARSAAEFISKIGIAIEEADEAKGWLELLVASNRVPFQAVAGLIDEADQLTRIFVASRKTAGQNAQERNRIEEELRKRLKARSGRLNAAGGE